MGVRRRAGQSIGRDDLEDEGVEAIKRDVTGNVRFTNLATKTATVTGTATSTLTTSATTRQFASSANVKLSEAAAGTVAFTLKRDGAAVTSQTGVTATTTVTTQNTFTASTPSWSLVVNATAGSWKVTNWTQSVDQARG